MAGKQRLPEIKELVIYKVDGKTHRVLDVSYNPACGVYKVIKRLL